MTGGTARDGGSGRRAALPLPSPPLVDRPHGIVLRPWGRGRDDATALAAAWRDPTLRATTSVPADASLLFARRWIAGEAERRARGLALDLVVSSLPDPGHPRAGDPPAGSVLPDAGAAPGGPVWGEVGLRSIDPVAGRAEVGWWIAPGQRGRGLASAAVDLLSAWALGPPLGLRQVWARIDPANHAAARVASRAGYARLGHAGGTVVWARAAAIVAS